MTSVIVTLSKDLDLFVQNQVASGDYPDAEAVVRAGLYRLEAEAERESEKMDRFLAAVQVGVDELDRGEGIEVTDIEAYLDALVAEVEAEFANKAA